MYFNSKLNKGHAYRQAGFTLIELIICIGIVTVILSVIIFNQPTYTDRLALSNLADEISISLFQAQAYGVGAKETSTGSNVFNKAYGISFNTQTPGNKLAYIFFVDKIYNYIYNGDPFCNPSPDDECVTRTVISRGNYVNDLCLIRLWDADQCNLGRIDISFTRPTVEPTLRFFGQDGGSHGAPDDTLGARIVLRSPKGVTKIVEVYTNGQITVR